MESVEDLMKRMQLSEAEKKGIRIGSGNTVMPWGDNAPRASGKEGEAQQFSKNLRFIPEKRRWDGASSGRTEGNRYVPPWRGGGRSLSGGSVHLSAGRSGSDAPSWKKAIEVNANAAAGKGEEDEVTSPLKKCIGHEVVGKAKKNLFTGGGGIAGSMQEDVSGQMMVVHGGVKGRNEKNVGTKTRDLQAANHAGSDEKVALGGKTEERRFGTFKRRERVVERNTAAGKTPQLSRRKRSGEETPDVVMVDGEKVVGESEAGIRKAAEVGMGRVIVETDSMTTKAALSTNSFALAPVVGIIYEAKCLMNLSISSCALSYCSRDCNKVAHTLAEQGCKCSHGADLYWEGMPSGVENLMVGDLTEPISNPPPPPTKKIQIPPPPPQKKKRFDSPVVLLQDSSEIQITQRY
ncbi:hypothetical protein C2845_PM05G33580 [Panicum miliaceum]|uniref:RNase H type-1 domain-containing protein n=1 Tax=Panicum miliaceum TaxID=4540 RepID=A0A3L6STG8_PANMI|nr:hypothetical protein C2845_PM05G33580 [Panicum miliaceum]